MGQGDKIKMFDAATSRPLSNWTCAGVLERPCRFIVHDALQPNVFYAGFPNHIQVYDRNVKGEVRNTFKNDLIFC